MNLNGSKNKAKGKRGLNLKEKKATKTSAMSFEATFLTKVFAILVFILVLW
jgi:hypothetical protein